LKILDWYILKRYLGTFTMMLLLFIPIGITVNLAEKIDKILENEVPFIEVAYYYLDFTIYFANLLFPIFLFLSVIWFTSKLAMNTEIVAFLSSGVSFYRFLRPYLIAATTYPFKTSFSSIGNCTWRIGSLDRIVLKCLSYWCNDCLYKCVSFGDVPGTTGE